ncbi:MAG: FAD-dependent oxidoreductase [Bacilli bacterium]|nr:FAD-dependent oxidoreductase [Bacilli bacterium]
MKHNVIIIGAGVSGMTAALYLKRAGIDCIIIEKEMPGGQINYTSTIENYPGFANILGSDLAINIYKQITDIGVEVLFDEVIEVKNEKNKKIVITKNQKLETEYLIIATGRSPKNLNVKGEEKLKNKGISYCAICDGSLYKDKEVVVIGAGASSIKESLYLSNICKKVTILNRRDEFRKTEDTKELTDQKNIEIKYNSEVKEFVGEKKLEEINLKNGEKLKPDGCFIFIGYNPKTNIFNNLNITNKEGYIEINKKFETKIENIYAIGDVTTHPIFQIITCMSDAITASFDIIEKINKDKSN